MGGTSGGTQVVYPQAPQPPSAAQSAADYAQALPQIYNTSLQYQPQFDQAQLQSAQTLAPQYAQLYNQINQQVDPKTAGLQEQLAGIAAQGATDKVPQSLADQYRSDLNAQLGSNVNSGIGADYVSRGLINQQQQYNQYYQNLGLSVAGRQPLVNGQTAQQPSNFGVANSFLPNYQTQMQGYGSYASASRPITTQSGTPNWISGLQAGGSVLQGVGSLAAFCHVGAEIFGGRNHYKTIAARLYVYFLAPKWFKNWYGTHGESMAKIVRAVPALKTLLRPLFESFYRQGLGVIHGSV